MHTIIIGDIVGSRQQEVSIWLPVLEKALQKYSQTFEIFRGDSFQADIPLEKCFEFLFYLKARIKAAGKLDVRIGIGIGTVDYIGKAINSSNGEAFVHAGEAFDTLKKDLVALRSPWKDYDVPVNIMLQTAVALTDRWTTNMAETIAAALAYPDRNQQDLTKVVNRNHQSQVSTELRKGYYALLCKVVDYCTQELQKRC